VCLCGICICVRVWCSWLYNLFASDIADSFKGSIQGQVRQTQKQQRPTKITTTTWFILRCWINTGYVLNNFAAKKDRSVREWCLPYLSSHSSALLQRTKSTRMATKRWRAFPVRNSLAAQQFPWNYRVNQILSVLATVVVKIDDYAQANYALVAAPSFTSSFIETNHKVLRLPSWLYQFFTIKTWISIHWSTYKSALLVYYYHYDYLESSQQSWNTTDHVTWVAHDLPHFT